MIYLKSLFPVICILSIVAAQIPNFGRCPTYESMPDFDRENFLGKWYEAERYFTVSELASRCVAVNYERRSDGKIYVNNEMVNRFTNVQRIVSGVMSLTGKNDEATFTVKYQSLPVNYDTTLHVLGTDYDSYAVIWSCNPLAGPVGHTESVWIMTRERIPDGPVLQAAYGVLDKFRISRTFFVKTDQIDCDTKGDAEEAADEPNSGYDIVVDDETVGEELYNNNGYGNPQVHQIHQIQHLQQLQEIGYYKQNDAPAEKSAINGTQAIAADAVTKAKETKDSTTVPPTKLSLPIVNALADNTTHDEHKN